MITLRAVQILYHAREGGESEITVFTIAGNGRKWGRGLKSVGNVYIVFKRPLMMEPPFRSHRRGLPSCNTLKPNYGE